MAKTNESGGGVWDQDITPAQVGAGAGSTLVRRTQSGSKENLVRDDWDEDEDDEDAEWEREGQGKNGRIGDREEHTVRNANGDNPRSDELTSPKSNTRGGDGDDGGQIWEEANKRTPMPELIVARASTSHSFPPPPPAALQPTLRILKRPSLNAAGGVPGSSSPPVSSSSSGMTLTPGGSGTVSPTPRGTLAEREAQYQEARNRIFGERDKDKPATGGVVVLRDPLGPESELEDGTCGPVKGFGERRRGKK
ncbi:hypothetical protein JVU11DRAFT_6083 [Chiua virens]|nr:hypothetical protein JVU11DRAFT_6083 [Chiua virens]